MSEPNPSPLQGKHILVTRTREQASSLSERLRSLGATPLEFPTIRIVPPQDWSALDSALQRLYSPTRQGYDWLVFTSANGVTICCERLLALGYDLHALPPALRIAAIGPATAATLARYGIATNLVPNEYIAEGVASALIAAIREQGTSPSGQRILLPRAAEARAILVTELQQAGALVDEVAAYFTHPVPHDDEQGRQILNLLRERRLDLLTFTSSSTVRNFVAWLKSCQQETTELLFDLVTDNIHIASIGPITSQTARDLGLPVTIEASIFTIDGLVDAIVHYYSKKEEIYR